MGELVAAVPPTDVMPLVLRPHPFSADAGVVYARPGQTIGQMLRAAAGDRELAPVEVRVGGYEVPAAMWDRLRPKQGAVIEVTGLPQGNMNANWRAVLMIVVMVVAWYAAPALAGTWGMGEAAWGSAIMMVGNLAINALVKPPQPLTNDGPKQWNQLTGNSNQINPGGPIPHVLGEARYFPPHAAMPYAVATGAHSYQYCLFDLGYNVEPDDVDWSTATIGSTSIAAYEGVTYQISTNPSLYRNDAAQTAIGIEMEGDDTVIRTTAMGTETISLDFICPQGYYGVNDTGTSKFGMDMYWDVHYRATGTSGAWLVPPSPRLSNLNNHAGPEGMYTKWLRWYDPFAFGLAWDVPAGQYDVRVTRRDSPTGSISNTYVDMCIWNSLLSVRNVPASRTGTMKIAMRIRADNQLNGTLQTFSVLVKPKYPVYDESAGTWSRQRTLNAGWLYHYLLTTCPDTARKVAPSRMNLTQILDFVDFCDRHELETRMVVDTGSTVGQVVDMLLRASGGERTMTDGKYGVTFVPDYEPIAAAPFAPTEVKDFTLSRTFSRIPHALRVKFRNPMAGWQDDEIIVLDDGYSYRGVDARGVASALPEPTIYEELNLQATMLPQQAWRMARMHFAQAKFSGGSYSWQSDIAALKLTKGSACTVAHEVPQWGAGFARVVSYAEGAPVGVATLVLDAEIESEAGKSYRMQIRSSDGVQTVNCVPHSTRTTTFYLTALPGVFRAGDLAILGETDIARPLLLVTNMRANADLEFTVNGVAWDERAAPYWANPPASMVSEISGRPYLEAPDPPQIVVDAGATEQDDAGIRRPVLNVRAPDRGARHLPIYDVLTP